MGAAQPLPNDRAARIAPLAAGGEALSLVAAPGLSACRVGIALRLADSGGEP